jgi:hypothetical protein
MAEEGVLDRLTASLPMRERRDLFNKLSAQLTNLQTPLHNEPDQVDGFNIENQYKALPWFTRLWYVILGFVRNMSPVKAYEDRLIAATGKEIEVQTPGLYEYGRGFLLPEFYQELTNLKTSARFFYNALDLSVNRDKGVFYAFLASLEMEDIHRSLCAETDPEAIVMQKPAVSEGDIRQIIQQALEDNFAAISEDQRAAMYYNCRGLHCLKEISFFLFDRILLSFSHDKKAGGMVCRARIVKEQLRDLNNVLYSFRNTPSPAVLESLFIFAFRESAGDETIEPEIKRFAAQAESALAIIRYFNHRVSLTRILRCAARDLSLVPVNISGGEDWYNLFREYWRRYAEERLSEYMRRFRRKNLMNTINAFLKENSFRGFVHTAADTIAEGIPLIGGFNLAFLRAFYDSIFYPEIRVFINPIVLDGDFVTLENRIEFVEKYNNLFRLGDTVKEFEDDISREGDLGKAFEAARLDITALAVKRRKLQVITDKAADKAERIITQARNSMTVLLDMLNVILNKTPPVLYTGIKNFNELAKKKAGLAEGIDSGIQKLKTALQIMEAIDKADDGAL